MVNGNPSHLKKPVKPLNSVVQQAKDIVRCLEGVVDAFETSVIGSDDYKDKAMLLHQNVCALAKLHPNWSDERKIILNVHKHDAPPLDDSDPFILIYELSEAIFRSWHQMRVPQPSIRRLTKGGEMFRAALAHLQNECAELTNRKACHHRHSETNNPSVTVVVQVGEDESLSAR
jgi:hypothetical protein